MITIAMKSVDTPRFKCLDIDFEDNFIFLIYVQYTTKIEKKPLLNLTSKKIKTKFFSASGQKMEGFWGEEIFCPRADEFSVLFLPRPPRAGGATKIQSPDFLGKKFGF